MLLDAGIPLPGAWRYLADGRAAEPSGPVRGTALARTVLQAAATAAHEARPIGTAVVEAVNSATASRRGSMPGSLRRVARASSVAASEADAWRTVAAALLLTAQFGAPLGPALRELSLSLRSVAGLLRARTAAMAGPKLTARVITVLPFAGLLLAAALGTDVLGALSSPLGLTGVLAGAALIAVAAAWSRWLLWRSVPTDWMPGAVLDLMALAVAGGASVPAARAAVLATATDLGLPTARDLPALDRIVALAAAAGVPLTGLLRAEAEQRRREERSVAELAGETLAITLLLPLGVCVLPAFLLLAVAPILIAVVSSTVPSL